MIDNMRTVPANPAVSGTVTVVKAPGLTVRKKDGPAYCASMITTASQNGRWGLAFLCSGGLQFLPWDEVAGVEYYPAAPSGRQHCDVCDSRLIAYPSGEAETGAIERLARAEVTR
jgi:hypothetical protein